MKYAVIPLLGELLFAAAPDCAYATTLSKGYIEKSVTRNLTDPTALVFAPDGMGLVAERSGKIYRLDNDSLNLAPLLSLQTDTVGERGLLGLALDPAFAANHQIYVAYFTMPSFSSHLIVSSFTMNGATIDQAKESVLLILPNANAAVTHLGGALACGPDGKLYVGVGDHQQPQLAQDFSSPVGKILRITTGGIIPGDNPFYATATGLGKAVWAGGFGNPVAMTFQPATGRLLVNDALAGDYQEIDNVAAKGNYGWPIVSGPSADSRFIAPFHAYANAEGCRIRNGDFQIGTATAPEFAGLFLFADGCAGWVGALSTTTGARTPFASGMGRVTTIKFGPHGELYYAIASAQPGAGGLSKFVYAPELSVDILTQPLDAFVQEGEPVTFKVTAASKSPMHYQWRKNGTDIAGANTESLALASVLPQDDGARFSVAVFNDYVSVLSRDAVLTVGSILAPSIVTQPADVAVRLGQPASFSVGVEGSPPFTYRWSRNGVPIPGANSAVYTIAATVDADNGTDYLAEVSNVRGLVATRRAMLRVAGIGFHDLADLHFFTSSNWRGPVELDMSNGEADAQDGEMISIGSRLYKRGVGVYAKSEITLDISAGCDSFYTDVGVDGERGGTGTVSFDVVGDSTVLYHGNVMTATTPPAHIALSLTGRSMLRLRVNDGGDASGNDYANWADARLKCWDNLVTIHSAAKRRMPGRMAAKGLMNFADKESRGNRPGAEAAYLSVFDMQGRRLEGNGSIVENPLNGPVGSGNGAHGAGRAAGWYPYELSRTHGNAYDTLGR